MKEEYAKADTFDRCVQCAIELQKAVLETNDAEEQGNLLARALFWVQTAKLLHEVTHGKVFSDEETPSDS